MATFVPPIAVPRPFGRTFAIYLKEAKYEFLTRLRLRAYSLATVGFPVKRPRSAVPTSQPT